MKERQTVNYKSKNFDFQVRCEVSDAETTEVVCKFPLSGDCYKAIEKGVLSFAKENNLSPTSFVLSDLVDRKGLQEFVELENWGARLAQSFFRQKTIDPGAITRAGASSYYPDNPAQGYSIHCNEGSYL